MSNRLLFLLLIGLPLACTLKPGTGPAGGNDVVRPLWEEVSMNTVVGDTTQCANVVALLIGIGQYNPASGWEPLQTQNDVRRMTETLRKQGVSPTKIHRLVDQQATRAGIIHALQTLADTLSRGSRLIIFYGGHACQLPDNNGDEIDGQDEAIVPYDAPSASRSDTSGYLRDDELNQYLTRIRAALGPAGSVWLLFDSCHSQTLNRGAMSQSRHGPRTTTGLLIPPGNASQNPELTGSDWYETPGKREKLAHCVLFAATTDSGSDFETTDATGQSLGSLTRALSDVWSNAPVGESYRNLFNRVAVAMAQFAPYQQPTLEGDADTPTPGCWGMAPTSAFYRTRGQGVRVVWPRGDAGLTQLMTALPFVQIATTRPDLRIVRRGRGYGLLLASNNQPLTNQPLTAEASIERIRQFFARNVLLQLQQTNPDFQVRASLRRLTVQTDNGQTTVTDTLLGDSRAGLPQFWVSATERMLLTLTNTGPQPYYLSVVDLQPDGTLHVLLPETDHDASEYQLLPGQSLHRRIRLTYPLGAEVYKLLLTPNPIDLRAVLQTRGHHPAIHPYETIFQRIYATRGMPLSVPASLSDQTGATAEVAFWVKD